MDSLPVGLLAAAWWLKQKRQRRAGSREGGLAKTGLHEKERAEGRPGAGVSALRGLEQGRGWCASDARSSHRRCPARRPTRKRVELVFPTGRCERKTKAQFFHNPPKRETAQLSFGGRRFSQDVHTVQRYVAVGNAHTPAGAARGRPIRAAPTHRRGRDGTAGLVAASGSGRAVCLQDESFLP